MPTPRVTSVAMSAVPLCHSSSSRGMNSTTARPTSGTNTARVRPHVSKKLIDDPFSSQREHHEGGAEEEHRREQVQGVLLHAPGLDQPQRAAGFAGADADP